ncbi:hypothetical protein C2I06_19815 [Niallia circulans]|nr:hypothetical protein C2I06_19815 [Niallia circulans]
MPPLKVQQKIGKFLYSLDAKIEINNKLNNKLERLASTIYNKTFLYFGSYNEDEIIENDYGKVPLDWHVKTIEEITSTIIDYRGKTPKKLGSDWSSEGILALSAKIIKNNRLVNLSNSKFVSEELYEKWMKEELEAKDIILTSEAPLGELYYIAEFEKYCLSQRVYCLRANPKLIHPAILFMHLMNPIVKQDIQSRATGSTVTGIRQSELRKVKVLVPPKTQQEEIGNLLDSLLTKVNLLQKENIATWNLRNKLVTKLVTGQIDI